MSSPSVTLTKLLWNVKETCLMTYRVKAHSRNIYRYFFFIFYFTMDVVNILQLYIKCTVCGYKNILFNTMNYTVPGWIGCLVACKTQSQCEVYLNQYQLSCMAESTTTTWLHSEPCYAMLCSIQAQCNITSLRKKDAGGSLTNEPSRRTL